MLKKIILGVVIFFISVSITNAANTSGYAWSESLGWFDFSDVTVSDTEVTGYAYNDNTGWLVFSNVTNSEGTLSGYAWSESLGWFDFSDVYIEDGAFRGYAYNDNTGWLVFEDNTTVATTWSIATSSSNTSGENSSGSQRRGGQKKINIAVPDTPTVVSTSSQNLLSIYGLLVDGRDLELGMTGDDVKMLQKFLNSQEFIVNATGEPGSVGYETTYFGIFTQKALIKFQEAHNIKPSLGYFGPITKAFIKNNK